MQIELKRDFNAEQISIFPSHHSIAKKARTKTDLFSTISLDN